GAARYPSARRLLVTCDAGGSNGYRCRLWKDQLAKVAEETGLEIRVCHFPPGTSKWNQIEHRLFCHITRTWRARPLMTKEEAVACPQDVLSHPARTGREPADIQARAAALEAPFGARREHDNYARRGRGRINAPKNPGAAHGNRRIDVTGHVLALRLREHLRPP